MYNTEASLKYIIAHVLASATLLFILVIKTLIEDLYTHVCVCVCVRARASVYLDVSSPKLNNLNSIQHYSASVKRGGA